MVKCLVTKLSGSVENKDLPRLGYIRGKFLVDAKQSDTRVLGTNDVLVDGTLAQMQSNEILGGVSAGKYVDIRKSDVISVYNLYLDEKSGLEYAKKLTTISYYGFKPNMTALKLLPNLQELKLGGTFDYSYSYADIAKIQTLRKLSINNVASGISGKVSDIANAPNLKVLGFNQSNGNLDGWTKNLRNSAYPIISVPKVTDNIWTSGSSAAAFLINMSNCQNWEGENKVIKLNTTFSSSDKTEELKQAIQKLQGYGFEVSPSVDW